jgi:hypothetical protein
MFLLPIVAEIAGEAALKSMPQKFAVEHIDASLIGILVGGVTTGIAVAGLFLLVGWLLVKYGAIKIGAAVPIAVVPSDEDDKKSGLNRFVISPEFCVDCGGQKMLSAQHEVQITDLYGKWNSIKDNMGTMAIDIGSIKTDVANIKSGITDLQSRRGGR